MKKPATFVSNPGTKTYPTNIGAPAFTLPDIITKKRDRGIDAAHQLESKFNELREEYFKLVKLAEDTERMYSAKCNFNPVVGNTYHLYKNKNHFFVSIIAPNEWNMEFHVR